MGGVGNVENQVAGTWLMALTRGSPTDELRRVFHGTIREQGVVGLDEGRVVLVAAEVVATGIARPPSGPARDALVHIVRQLPDLAGLVGPAITAVEKVATDGRSALFTHWDEAGEIDPWLDAVEELLARLSPP